MPRQTDVCACMCESFFVLIAGFTRVNRAFDVGHVQDQIFHGVLVRVEVRGKA